MSTARAVKTAQSVLADERIVSADSHIMEPVDLWEKNLTPGLKEKFPKFPPRNSPGEKPGGWECDLAGTAGAFVIYERLLRSVLGGLSGFEHAGEPAHPDGIQLQPL